MGAASWAAAASVGPDPERADASGSSRSSEGAASGASVDLATSSTGAGAGSCGTAPSPSGSVDGSGIGGVVGALSVGSLAVSLDGAEGGTCTGATFCCTVGDAVGAVSCWSTGAACVVVDNSRARHRVRLMPTSSRTTLDGSVPPDAREARTLARRHVTIPGAPARRVSPVLRRCRGRSLCGALPPPTGDR